MTTTPQSHRASLTPLASWVAYTNMHTYTCMGAICIYTSLTPWVACTGNLCDEPRVSYMHTHTHAHARTRTHTHAHAHTCMHTHTHARTHTHVHARTHAHTCMHTRTHVHAHTHTRACTHTRTHAYTCMHTHTHARTRTHTCMHRRFARSRGRRGRRSGVVRRAPLWWTRRIIPSRWMRLQSISNPPDRRSTSPMGPRTYRPLDL